jgi:hypothetical protein
MFSSGLPSISSQIRTIFIWKIEILQCLQFAGQHNLNRLMIGQAGVIGLCIPNSKAVTFPPTTIELFRSSQNQVA